MLICLVVVTVTSFATHAQEILDYIEVDSASGQRQILVHFLAPMQYLTHTPRTTGDQVQVQLRPLAMPSSAGQDLFREESLNWTPTADVPLSDVRFMYDSATNTQLLVRFERTVEYRISMDPSLRVLVISLTTPGSITEPVAPENPIDVRSSLVPIEPDSPPPPAETGRETLADPETELALESSTILNSPDIKPSVTFPVESPDTVPPEVLQRLQEGRRAQAEDERLEALAQPMEEARQAFSSGDFPRAIQLYTKVLKTPDTPYRQDAQEFLAVSRERNGQLAHAKMQYETYLELYPEGEASDRVLQRLQALVTASLPDSDKLRVSSRGATGVSWDYYGGASQFFRTNEIAFQIDGREEDLVNLSSLFTDVDITLRRRSADLDIRTRLTGSHVKDFLEGTSADETQITSAYIDVNHLRRDITARVGRQNRSTGGVLGRFDGLSVGYRVNPRTKLNLVAGNPVELRRTGTETDRSFYGVSAEFGTFNDAWDFVPFVMMQTIDGIDDRQALGIETRFFSPQGSLLSLVDYDLSYGELNNLLVIGNWTPTQFTFNAVLDIRKSPVLTTKNALVGQSVASIDELLLTYTEDEVRELARDRSAESRSLTVGASRPISARFQLSGDITVTQLSDTRASGGVAAIPGTEKEVFYNLQLIANSLLLQGDMNIIGLRYVDATRTQTTTLSLNTRYPISPAWRINPRLRIDRRIKKTDQTRQLFIAPSLKVEYRSRNNVRFELEAGWQSTSVETFFGEDETSGLFYNVGYYANF